MVTSLYTIIPHNLGLDAVRGFLVRDSGLPTCQTSFIMELLVYVASHNYFWFSNQFFRQSRGVAMGANYAPSLANVFMAKWEEDAIYAHRSPHLVLWARYIDDILLLWDGNGQKLHEFMSSLNLNDCGIHLNS